MSTIDNETLTDGLAWGAIGFGALATVAPGVFERVYGLAETAELRARTRLWGTRTTVLGLALLGADRVGRSKLTRLAAAMNAADALLIAGNRSGASRRSRVLGSLSSAVFAAGFGTVLGRS